VSRILEKPINSHPWAAPWLLFTPLYKTEGSLMMTATEDTLVVDNYSALSQAKRQLHFQRRYELTKDETLDTERLEQTAQRLAHRLFEEIPDLQCAIGGGMIPMLEEVRLEHFVSLTPCDFAVSQVWRNNLGPSRLLVQSAFYAKGQLVTLATQDGVLAFEELL
jgi:hypothetical protein